MNARDLAVAVTIRPGKGRDFVPLPNALAPGLRSQMLMASDAVGMPVTRLRKKLTIRGTSMLPLGQNPPDSSRGSR
jgi:hypothetical protein